MIQKKLIKVILLGFFCNILCAQEHPIVCINRYLGLLGNQLFQFSLGMILSKEFNIPLVCPPIYGFPETYLHRTGKISSQFPTQQLSGHAIDFKGICADKTPRNIVLSGLFQRYEYYKEYTADIKHWLRFDSKPVPQNPDDIVVHVRVDNPPAYLPFKYYEDALNATTFNRLYICTNEPRHPFIQNFRKYNPIIKSTTSLKQLFAQGKSYEEIIRLTVDDFKFITSFNKIVTSQSTFVWWAAFLSDAQEVYAPLPDKGYMSSQRPDIQWGVEEERYHYIPCKVDRAMLVRMIDFWRRSI